MGTPLLLFSRAGRRAGVASPPSRRHSIAAAAVASLPARLCFSERECVFRAGWAGLVWASCEHGPDPVAQT